MKMITAGTVLAVAGALVALPLGAQQGPPAGRPGRGMLGAPRAHAGQRIEMALDHRAELELTEEQVASLEGLLQQVRAARDSTVQRMRAIRDEAAGDRAEIREQMGQLREEMRAQASDRETLRDILSDEQLQELGPAAMGPRGSRGARGFGAGPGLGRGGGGGLRMGPPAVGPRFRRSWRGRAMGPGPVWRWGRWGG